MFLPKNRLSEFFPVEAPPVPTVGDKLLSNAHGIKMELIRFQDEGEANEYVSFEIHGTIDGDDDTTLAALLAQFRQPRGTEGAA